LAEAHDQSRISPGSSPAGSFTTILKIGAKGINSTRGYRPWITGQ